MSKKKTVQKKQILFIALILALSGAMYLNWYYTKPKSERPVLQKEESQTHEDTLGEAKYVNAEKKDSFFDEAVLKRTKAHANAQESFQKILEDEKIGQKEKETTQKNLNSLSKNMKLEGDIENLILAKTGAKSIVTINDTVEAIIEKGKLNSESALQIKEIIVNITKISSEKITLVEVK